MSVLKIQERMMGDVTILELNGRIVFGDESALVRETIKRLLKEGRKKILMNMGGVTYVDSGGNGTVVAAVSTTVAAGGMIRFLNVVGRYRDLLQIQKFTTVFDIFYNEQDALDSFRVRLLNCFCPVCGQDSKPLLYDQQAWSTQLQTCNNPTCQAQFTVVSHRGLSQSVSLKRIRISTYVDEGFEILPGTPVAVQVVGRLDLFSSSALKKVWQTIHEPRRVLFELHRATEIDDAGREALLALLSISREGGQAVVSLEGLDRDQMKALPSSPPFYRDKSAALAAIGEFSDAHPWLVKTAEV